MSSLETEDPEGPAAEELIAAFEARYAERYPHEARHMAAFEGLLGIPVGSMLGGADLDPAVWKAYRVFAESLGEAAKLVDKSNWPPRDFRFRRPLAEEQRSAVAHIEQMHHAATGDQALRREFLALVREAARQISRGGSSASEAAMLIARASRHCGSCFSRLDVDVTARELGALTGTGIYVASRLSLAVGAFGDGPRTEIHAVARRYMAAVNRPKSLPPSGSEVS